MMLSKFSRIIYDAEGGKEQNKLRSDFKKYEQQLLAGDMSEIASLPLPEGEYKDIANRVRLMFLAYPTMRLQCLELMYFIYGKEIWRKQAEKQGLA